MRPLTAAALISAGLALPVEAYAEPEPELFGRFGVLAAENSSTTRSLMPELVVGGRLPVGDAFGVSAAYRGSYRDAGNPIAGVLSIVQRLDVSATVRFVLGPAHLGAGLGGAAVLETTRLDGRGVAPVSTTTLAPGFVLGLEAGLTVTESVDAVFQLGALSRRGYLDLEATFGVRARL